MTPPKRPEVIVFDVVGTLADLTPVRERMESVGLPDFEGWFTHMLRDAMALSYSGAYQSFLEVAKSTLYSHSRGSLSGADIDGVLEGFSETTPHPDAFTAVDEALASGMRVFTLSNGSVESTEGFLERAGLRDRVEKVLSIDEVRAWKPSRAPYDLAVKAAGVDASEVALVAVHAWDVHGAKRAGLLGGWCSREEDVPTPAFAQADVVGETLDAVVQGLTRGR